MAENNLTADLGEVFKPIVDSALEYERLKCYLRVYLNKRICRASPCSVIAKKEFDIPFESLGNTICGLLEELTKYKNK